MLHDTRARPWISRRQTFDNGNSFGGMGGSTSCAIKRTCQKRLLNGSFSGGAMGEGVGFIGQFVGNFAGGSRGGPFSVFPDGGIRDVLGTTATAQSFLISHFVIATSTIRRITENFKARNDVRDGTPHHDHARRCGRPNFSLL
jgi:hypothetical protein